MTMYEFFFDFKHICITFLQHISKIWDVFCNIDLLWILIPVFDLGSTLNIIHIKRKSPYDKDLPRLVKYMTDPSIGGWLVPCLVCKCFWISDLLLEGVVETSTGTLILIEKVIFSSKSSKVILNEGLNTLKWFWNSERKQSFEFQDLNVWMAWFGCFGPGLRYQVMGYLIF